MLFSFPRKTLSETKITLLPEVKHGYFTLRPQTWRKVDPQYRFLPGISIKLPSTTKLRYFTHKPLTKTLLGLRLAGGTKLGASRTGKFDSQNARSELEPGHPSIGDRNEPVGLERSRTLEDRECFAMRGQLVRDGGLGYFCHF